MSEAERLFQLAADLPAHERAPFLDGICKRDLQLRRRVEQLLAADARENTFLDQPHDCDTLRLAPADANGNVALPRIGPYMLRSILGRGGMAVVYLAEQPSPQRLVAVKLLSPITATDSLIRRFQLEAEILASLTHEGIARVFDQGVAPTAIGPAHYFVMEYVPGRSITEYARACQLDTRSVVSLMIAVCDAMQHAHGKGVIHRDLKPSNIIVGEDGVPRVVDFGVARRDEHRTGDLVLTRPGQFVGTLPYMGIEQLEGGASAVDVRADVYGLGAVLYELLSGRRPFEEVGDDAVRLAASIRLADGLFVPARLVPPDLRAIVRKATRRSTEDRYASAAAIASDLRSFQEDMPVSARMPTRTEALRRALRHNRRATLSTVLVILAAVVIGGIGFGQWRRAELAEGRRGEAEQAARLAEAAASARSDATRDMLLRLNSKIKSLSAPRQFALQDALEVISESLAIEHYPNEPRRAAEMHRLFGNVCYYNAGLNGLAVKHLRRSKELYEVVQATTEAAQLSNLLAHALANIGQFNEAEVQYKEALDIAEQSPEFGPGGIATLYTSLGEVRARSGDYDNAAAALRTAIELTPVRQQEALISRKASLGDVLRSMERFEDARSELNDTMDMADGLGAARLSVTARRYLARLEYDVGNYDLAESLQREALRRSESSLGDHHIETGSALVELATTLTERGDRQAAEELLRKALSVAAHSSQPYPRNQAVILGALADLLEQVPSRSDEAAELRGRAEAARARAAAGG